MGLLSQLAKIGTHPRCLYEFLTNFLPRFYAATNVIRWGGRSLSPTPESLGSRRWFLQDLIFVAVSIAFFVIAVVYVQFCDRIR